MNWLDIVLLLILIVSVATSFRKGFSRELIGFVTVVLALLLGAWFYGMAGSFLVPYLSSLSMANFAGFFVVFCGVMIAGAVVSFAVGRFLKVTGLSFFDHILGAAFGLVRAVVVGVAVVMAMMAFAPGEKPPKAVARSRFAPYFADAARVAASVAPHELREGVRKTYAELKTVWDKALDNNIRRVVPGTDKGGHEREI